MAARSYPWKAVRLHCALSKEEATMQTSELVQAAATIAAGMVATQEGQPDQATMNRIAQTAVEIARRIEEEVRKAYG
jgi:hypothetical protein